MIRNKYGCVVLGDTFAAIETDKLCDFLGHLEQQNTHHFHVKVTNAMETAHAAFYILHVDVGKGSAQEFLDAGFFG